MNINQYIIESGEVMVNRGSRKGSKVYAFKFLGMLFTTNKNRTKVYKFDDSGWSVAPWHIKWLLLATFWKLKVLR